MTPTQSRILDAARSLVFVEGFAAITTDRLCREAGVSKSSLYKYFGDMAGVLSAVVRREGDVFTVGVDAKPTSAAGLKSALITYGTNLLELLNQPFCVQFDRVMHEEARRHPDIASLFYESSYGRSHQEVAALLREGQAQGFIDQRADPSVLADHLLSMWNGLAQVRTRIGLQGRPTQHPARWATQCVTALLLGVQSSTEVAKPISTRRAKSR